MSNSKIKIFLSYHKNTPCYKSEIFQPLLVGASINKYDLEFALKDNTGDNISFLNPYYCELTGHYWVLKNYINDTDADYIGFAHYRRLPDLLNISDKDTPSIYGLSYSKSLKLFEEINTKLKLNDLYKYDIIYPCSCYMYKNTVNPILRHNEKPLTFKEHFLTEHNSNLFDKLAEVIEKFYSEYSDALYKCVNSTQSHFYNTYIMKTEILKQFLEWEFDVLDKVGYGIGGWEQDKYLRMAGFLAEIMINLWVEHKKDYTCGYVPLYMINFEADYIEKINYFHANKLYEQELSELENLLKITQNKSVVLLSMLEIAMKTSKKEYALNLLSNIEETLTDSDLFYQLAYIMSHDLSFAPEKTCEYFIKSLSFNDSLRLYAESFLVFAKNTCDLKIISKAWNCLNNFGLTKDEQDEYNIFVKKLKLLNNNELLDIDQ